MATRERVEEKLRALIARLNGNHLPGAAGESRVLSVHVSDHEADYWAQLAEGRMGDLQEGAPERPDIRITLTSDDLIELLDGRLQVASAFLTGRIKIDASLSDMMRLRKLLS